MNKNNFPTQKEKEILDVIIHYIEKYQYPPTIREICDMVGLKSTAKKYGYSTFSFGKHE